MSFVFFSTKIALENPIDDGRAQQNLDQFDIHVMRFHKSSEEETENSKVLENDGYKEEPSAHMIPTEINWKNLTSRTHKIIVRH